MELNDGYTRLFINLLPRGPAWEGGNPLLSGLALSCARVHQRGDSLMQETDPRTVSELTERYEKICGLPAPGVQTPAQRQQRLDAKINIAGGISKAFFLTQLAALGYPDATITTFDKDVFRCTSGCTDALYSAEWRYYWQINMPAPTKITDMTCTAVCASDLRMWGDTLVTGVINRLCPSHTCVLFNYPE